MWFSPKIENTLRDMFNDIIRSGPTQVQFAVPERWVQVELCKRMKEHKHFRFVAPGEPPIRSSFRPEGKKSDDFFVDLCAEYRPNDTEFLWLELKVEARPDRTEGWRKLLSEDAPKLAHLKVDETAEKWRKATEWWHKRHLMNEVEGLKSCTRHRFVCAYLQVAREADTGLAAEQRDERIRPWPPGLDEKRIRRYHFQVGVKECPCMLALVMWTADADELRRS